jgi:hypothetical protein
MRPLLAVVLLGTELTVNLRRASANDKLSAGDRDSGGGDNDGDDGGEEDKLLLVVSKDGAAPKSLEKSVERGRESGRSRISLR